MTTNSVDIHNGVAAVAIGNEDTQADGVVFFGTDGDYSRQVAAGALPDMLTFTPDGTKVVVVHILVAL